jgi:uncharacterized protein (TIGR00290 family)
VTARCVPIEYGSPSLRPVQHNLDGAYRPAMTLGKLVATSWSGGKDSAFALYRTVQDGGRPAALVTMLTEEGRRSRSHGIHRSILEGQAQRIGAALVVRATSWSGYEDAFVDALREVRGLDITECVFGDINFDENRAWEEQVCRAAGISALLPLWQLEREPYMGDLIGHGFRAKLIAVKDGTIPKDFLGRELDTALVDELRPLAIDIAGEAGEYHTLVTDCPLFESPMHVEDGDAVLRDGVWFLDQLYHGA